MGTALGAGPFCSISSAQSQVMGLDPGASTRAQVEKTLGRPVRQVSPTLYEYPPGPGIGKIEVEYRAGSDVADRIELHFLTEVTQAALAKKLNLTSPQSQKRNAQGNLVEYFEVPALALTYATGERDGGVARPRLLQPGPVCPHRRRTRNCNADGATQPK